MKNKLTLILLSVLLFLGCTDKENAEKFLIEQGYTDITITGYKFFVCGDKDSESTGFIARKNDKIVEGTVCTGMLLRNHTIVLK